MSVEEFAKILESTGLPVAYREFPEGEAPPLPFICYFETGSNNFAADGMVYFGAPKVAVELYTEQKDLEAEERVENALSSFYWEKEETYLDDEECYEVVYELEV